MRMFLILFGVGLIPTSAAAEKAAKGDPITPEMRAALQRANKAHAGVDRKALDEAIEDLHREIAKHDPKVFVPLAVPRLMALAPKESRTRTVLRKALAEGWLAETTARTLLVQAGDTPGPHVKALLKALAAKEATVRRAALKAARGFGAEGDELLPALRKILADSKGDPNDFRRAYASTRDVPEHVLASWAIQGIEAARAKLRRE